MTVNLDDSLLIASGLHRHCYVDPENRDRCIKVVFNGNQTETRREQSYYRLLQRRNTPWTCLPDFHGKVDTNLGEGAVFSLIRDADGQISRTLQYYLDNPGQCPHWQQLEVLLRDLEAYLLRYGIVTMTLKPKNILLQRRDGESDRLVIVDNIGCAEPLPLFSFFRPLARFRTRRRFGRFETKLKASCAALQSAGSVSV